MATVDGKTSIKIDQLINDTVVDGEVVDSHLILRTRGGAEIDAGVVTGGGSTSPLDVMPVGYIYMSVDPTSPATLFGGSWSRIGQGRVLVGQDSTQTEFDTVEETGGEKTHTITTAELPAHTHAVDHDHAAATTASDGNHTHVLERKAGAGTSTGVVRGNATASADGTTAAGGTHTHTVDIPAYTGNSGSVGSGTPANNLQPYLVVYMWKRIASSGATKYNGIASFSAQSSFVAIGKRKAKAVAAFLGQSSMTAIGTTRSAASASASFSAQSSMTAVGTVTTPGGDAATERESFNSGTSGTAIGANDGLMDGVFPTTPTGTMEYSNTRSVHGANSAHLSLASGERNGRYLDFGSDSAIAHFCMYLWLTDKNNTGTVETLAILDNVTDNTVARLILDTSGNLTAQDGTSTITGTPITLNTGQWYRIEWRWDYGDGSTTSFQTIRVWTGANLHSTGTPDYTLQSAAGEANAFSVCRKVRFGSMNNANAFARDRYIDAVGWRLADWVGPVS